MSEDLIKSLTNPVLQEFIRNHENDDEQSLILKHKTVCDVATSLVANQIKGRRKAKTKLPLFYNTTGIIYPAGKNLEQSSSEQTARFKSTLFNSGEHFVDLTAGFGIDTFFFSRAFNEADYVEPSAELLKIAKHNHECLGSKNIHYYQTSAEDFLNATTKTFNLIYLDPSRRTEGDQKVFRLAECTPNATALLPDILRRADFVLIKVSPLLDIQQGLKELMNVEKVFVVSVDNECKELLFLCRKDFLNEPVIETVNISSRGQERFQFLLPEEKSTVSEFSDAGTYLYEPNASILKAGAFRRIAVEFNLRKISPSTHLYTSENLIENFPGRIFKSITMLKPDGKTIKQHIPSGKANVITRNYPMTPEQLKKKLKLNDGGQQYIIGYSGLTEKFVMLADRIK